jgi:hypothetical protein
VSEGAQARTYLRRVRSSLRLPRAQRRRALEEIENHLEEGVAAHMQRGSTRPQAVARAIDELGPPEGVAAGFNEEAAEVPDTAGATRWLPMLVPALLLVVAGGQLVWSLTWLRGDVTVGEQVAQSAATRHLLPIAAIAAVLSYASYASIRRAHGDRSWRWVAWLCTGVALLSATW